MKLFRIIIVFAIILSFAPAVSADTAEQAALGRCFELRTTLDPERYALLTANGDVVYAEGFFAGATVSDFHIRGGGIDRREITLDVEDNGRFTGSFTGRMRDAGNATVVIAFDDAPTLSYRIEYAPEIGWFFPDNGLGAKTAAVVENHIVLTPQISSYYISAELYFAEINNALELLRRIVQDVTSGLDDDYQKAKALNAWVAENIAYDMDARDNEVSEESVSIAATLRDNRSVCIGIANLYGALLETAGIQAVNIKGGTVSAANGVTYENLPLKTAVHEWVAFWYEAEGRWVYTDPTWDRKSIYQNSQLTYVPPLYKHFDISPLALSFDHRGDRAEQRQYTLALEISAEPDTPEIGYTEPPEIPETPDVLRGAFDDDDGAGNGRNWLLPVIIAISVVTVILLCVVGNKKSNR
ncbi:MAG: transglutaminase-like domain-containing protein [Oscillospiraceae bacterium]|nr:transglutaminase-like domain-containing protein [Oscillospiraceae bacterium]